MRPAKPTEFGYVTQIAEITENTRRGARGLILPAATKPGNPGEDALLPDTVAELERLALSPREVALDGGFQTKASEQTLAPLAPERTWSGWAVFAYNAERYGRYA